MKMIRPVPVLLSLALALSFAAPLARAGDDTSLGDVAKKKNVAKAKRVITDDDLPSTSSSAPQTDENGGGASSQDKASGEPASKASLSELQKQLDIVNHEEADLKRKLEQTQQKADAAEDPFRKKMYEEAIQNQQTTLSEFAEKRRKLEEQIAAVKEKKQPS